MKVSLNTIRAMNKRYHSCDDVSAIGVAALIDKIGSQLGAVESVEPIGERYHGIIIAKVVACEQHTDSDHLNVCKIDDGKAASNVERDENGLVQVVCGAPNVHAGMLVAWLPPGTTVPESVGKEPFVLEARELRGVTSNGMLASAKELALGDNHDGILEITDPFNEVAVGADFADVFGLKDDVVLDIENKMFTHRPDCFGFLGISRELAGIQSLPFKSPAWYRRDAEVPKPETDILPLEVHVEVPELVPRFTMLALRDVKVGPSPTWLQIELAKLGQRPINNIVDLTNYFMLETGQPLHAYDYDKVRAQDGADKATIIVRQPRENERVKLLNGKEINPRQEAIMIATGTKLIGLAGVMGGADTEVDESTTNIILESATFDMYSVRRTSMAHGLFTDAVTRFTKGQSPLQTRTVLVKIVDDLRKFAGGKVASELIDIDQTAGRDWVHQPVPVSSEFINKRLGFELSLGDMKRLLENVEFKVDTTEDTMTVTTPFWRTDIETREDVVEEIGRLYGFDNVPLVLPLHSAAPTLKNSALELKAIIRNYLSRGGANEVLTYTFVHGSLLEKVGQKLADAFRVSNALSPDLQYYRLSLTPSLLEKVYGNVKAGFNEFAIFEMGKAHVLGEADHDGLPKEFERLALVYSGAKTAKSGAAYYEARQFLVDLLAELGQTVVLRPLPTHVSVMTAPFEPLRSAEVYLPEHDHVIGVVGELRASVRRTLKLPEQTAGFEINLEELLRLKPQLSRYVPLPRFPKVTQDITLRVPAAVTYEQLYSAVWQGLANAQPANVLLTLAPLDIYQAADDPDHKHISLRLTIASYDRTLTDNEIATLLDAAAQYVHTELGADKT